MNTFHNPDDLAAPSGFTHVSKSTCRTIVMVSGQVAYDESKQVIGVEDLTAQTRQVYMNIEKALHAAGASMRDVVKTVLFVRHLDADKARVIREARAPFFATTSPPASTMVGVASLAHPDLLLEVEAVAMLD